MSESITIELPGQGEPISLSENAAKQINTLLTKEAEGTMLRISVLGGGCSGFSYNFSFDGNKQEDDLVLERSGATVLIDEVSQSYLGGSEIDYVDDLIGSAFKINNPNATANCGCGTSFSV